MAKLLERSRVITTLGTAGSPEGTAAAPEGVINMWNEEEVGEEEGWRRMRRGMTGKKSRCRFEMIKKIRKQG